MGVNTVQVHSEEVVSTDEPSMVRAFWLVGLVASGLLIALGIVVLLNIIFPTNLPTNFRIMLGIILTLYGTYRFVILWIKKEPSEQQ